MLNEIYSDSKGYKFASIPFSTIYTKLLAWDEKEQQLVRESYDYLRKVGLLDSKSIGNVSITHEGIKEFEDAILRPNEGTTNFPPYISKTLSEESRELKKKEVETIWSQRRTFYEKPILICFTCGESLEAGYCPVNTLFTNQLMPGLSKK